MKSATLTASIVLAVLIPCATANVLVGAREPFDCDRIGTPMRLGTPSVEAWRVTALAYSPDNTLFTANRGEIGLCNGTTGAIIGTLPATGSADLLGFAFAGPDRLVTVNGEGQLIFWDVRTRQFALNERLTTPRLVDFAFRPAGPLMLATVTHDDVVHVWTLVSGEGRLLIKAGPQYQGTAVTFSADGQRLAYGGGPDGMIHVRELSTGEEYLLPDACTRRLTAARFLRGGRGLVANGYPRVRGRSTATPADQEAHTETLSVWDISSRRLMRTLSIESNVYQSCCMDLSGDGEVLAAVTHRALRIWSTDDWRMLRELRGDVLGGKFLRRIALSRDGRRMAVGDPGRTVQLWDPLEGVRIPRDRSTHPQRVAHVAASMDGRRLVSASPDGTVLVWGREKPIPILTLTADAVSSLTLSPSGDLLVTGGCDSRRGTKPAGDGGRCLFWSLADGRKLREVETAAEPSALRFSADGRLLAIATGHNDSVLVDASQPPGERAIVVWDVVKQAVAHEFTTELDDVVFLQFGNQGKQLTALSRDGRAALWDCQTLKAVASVDVGSGWEALGPDGNTVYRMRNAKAALSAQSARSSVVIQRLQPVSSTCEWDLQLRVALKIAVSSTDEVAVYGEDISSSGTGNGRALVVQTYRGSTGERLSCHGLDANVTCLAFSDDGRWLLAGLADGTSLVWQGK